MIQVNHRLHMSLLFLITIVGYGFYNAYLPITDPVESNYVVSALTMVDYNSWLSPMIYDKVWYDKPPLTYWALMICYKLFGISDFTSRIPNTLIAGGSISFMYYLVYKIKQSTKIAIWSAIILMSTLQFWYISHAVITDGFLFFFTLGIFGYAYLGLTQQSHTAMMKAYAFTGLAVLTKGPIGIILPGFILLVFIFLRKYISEDTITVKEGLKTLLNPMGLFLFCIIAGPWYIAMYSVHGQEFINGFLGLHNVSRVLVSEHPKFNVWYYYIAIIPIAMLPWTPMVLYRLKSINWKQPLHIFSSIWFLVFVIFYSLAATKYLTYTLPAIIPLIIWCGTCVAELIEESQKKLLVRILWIPILSLYIIFTIGTAYDSTLSVWPLLVSLLCIILLLVFTKWSHLKIDLLKLITTILVVMYSMVTITVVPILQSQSGIQFLSYIANQDKPVYVYGTYYTSLVYYTDSTPIQVFVSSKDDPRWTEGKNLMPTITKDEFTDTVLQSDSAIVIVPKKFIEDFKINPVSYFMTEVGHTKAGTVFELNKTVTY